jgi:hypothetical protein
MFDRCAFTGILGDSTTTGETMSSTSVPMRGVMSVKWRTMKVVLRYSESASGQMIKPQWPLVFDLTDDPVEEWDLIERRLDRAWVLAPVGQRLGALQTSAAAIPTSNPDRTSPATGRMRSATRDTTRRFAGATVYATSLRAKPRDLAGDRGRSQGRIGPGQRANTGCAGIPGEGWSHSQRVRGSSP